MILYQANRKAAPLLGPQLTERGPFQPGAKITVRVPLVNERTEALEDVKLRMISDHPSLSFDPEYLEVPLIHGGESLDHLTSTVTVPDIPTSQGELRIWAAGQHPIAGAFETAKTTIRIETRASLAATADGDILHVENRGTAAAHVTAYADREIPSSWKQPMMIPPNEAIDLILPPESMGVIRFVDEATKERVVFTDRRSLIEAPFFTAEGKVNPPDGGIRIGDLVPFEIVVQNTGGPAYNTVIRLNLPKGVTLAEGYTTRDNVALLPEDVQVTRRHATFALGVVQPGDTRLCAAVRLDDIGAEVDALNINGEIESGDSVCRVRVGGPITRVPALAGHGTYFGPCTEDEQGVLHTQLTITNSQGTSIRDAALALHASGLQIEHVYIAERELGLSADAVEFGVLADLGELRARSRVALDIRATRLPGAREVSIAASLVAHGRTVDLAQTTQTLIVEPRIVVKARAQREARVRLGMSCLLELSIENTGTDALRGVRIRPIVEEGVDVRLPLQQDTGWYMLGAPLPPVGGKWGVPVVVNLTEPPHGPVTNVAFEIDSENAAAVFSDTITLATPSSPSLVVSQPELTNTADRGLIEVKVRVANRSDGVAKSVTLFVRAEDRPVPFTATLDGHSIDETGRDASLLIEGLDLGDLPPNTQRDVAWLGAPSGASYATRITVRGTPNIERIAEGAIELVERGYFSTQPAPAARIDEQKPIAGVQGINVVTTIVSDIEKAVLAASAESSTPALAPSGAEPVTGELEITGSVQPALAQTTAPMNDEPLTAEYHREEPVEAVKAQDVNATAAGIAAAFRPESTPDTTTDVLAFLERMEQEDKAVAPTPAVQESEPVAEEAPRVFVVESGRSSAPVAETPAVADVPVAAAPIESVATAPVAEEEVGSSNASPIATEAGPASVDTTAPDVSSGAVATIEDFGLAVVEMLHGMIPDEWTTALAQAVAMRLVGPSESSSARRREIAAGFAAQLLADGITSAERVSWLENILARWEGRAVDLASDEKALRELQQYATPTKFADAFDDYLTALEERYPVRDGRADSYAQLLLSTDASDVADALAKLASKV